MNPLNSIGGGRREACFSLYNNGYLKFSTVQLYLLMLFPSVEKNISQTGYIFGYVPPLISIDSIVCILK